jgi:hypothetical protein
MTPSYDTFSELEEPFAPFLQSSAWRAGTLEGTMGPIEPKEVRMRTFLAVLLCCLLASFAYGLESQFTLMFDLNDQAVVLLHQDGRLDVGVRKAGEIVYDDEGQRAVKLAGVPIEYDPAGLRVVKIGNVAVQYDDTNTRVSSIGNFSVSYDPTGEYVTGVGDAKISYDRTGSRVTGVQGNIGSGMMLSVALK